MAYIVIVNPAILAGSGTGMPFAGVLSATVLIAFSMTLLMGLYARLPFAVAPGMGLNAFFAYTIVLQDKVPWQTALGMVFWAGVLFLVVSATTLRERIALAIPSGLRLSAAAGIGLLLTFVGLRNAGLIEPDPATMVRLGTLDHRSAFLLLGLVVAVVLMRRNNPLAFLSSIFVVTLLAWVMGYTTPPERLVSMPDFSSVLLRLDIVGALQLSLLPAIISILFTDLFDSLSTFIGVATAAGLTEPDGTPINLRRGLIVDALATLGAGLAGTSSGTAYVESIAGIRMGGRTGLTSVVTAALFHSVFLRGAAGRGGTRLCDGAGAHSGGRGDVPDGLADQLRDHRGLAAAIHHARADPAHVLDHAGHPVRLPSSRAALRLRRSRARGATRAMAACRALGGPSLSSVNFRGCPIARRLVAAVKSRPTGTFSAASSARSSRATRIAQTRHTRPSA